MQPSTISLDACSHLAVQSIHYYFRKIGALVEPGSTLGGIGLVY